MLATKHYPTTNNKFEKLDKAERTLAKWKEMYHAADMELAVKKKAHKSMFGGMANATSHIHD